MTQRTNRRDFLKLSAAAGLGYWVAGGLAPRESRAANDKLNFACIGVGGKGSSDTDHVAALGNVVALCDVDEDFLNEKAKKHEKAKKYFDFRKMFEEMGKEIDAVTVSTPDHTHAAASIMAMKLGKHVYCQKPLTHSVGEARIMRELALEKKVCTQMGNQGTAEDGLRRAVEFVQSGAIGKVREAHVWTNRPVWPQAPKITARPKEAEKVPSYLHWDEWLGPAPYRDYHHGEVNKKNPKRGTYHDFNWRGWWDFGTGALGDMGCHTANMAFMALKLGYPTKVAAEAGDVNPETYPAWAAVTLDFPARGEMQACKFFWYEGQKKDGKYVLPSPDLVKGQGERDKGFAIYFKENKWHFFNPNEKEAKKQIRVVSSGSFLVGEKAVLFSPDDYGADSYVVTSEGVERLTGKPAKLPSNNKGDRGQKEEWVAAIKAGKPELALSNFGYAGMLTEAILLGNIAVKLGKNFEWDGAKMKAKDLAAADAMIMRPYRKGWSL